MRICCRHLATHIPVGRLLQMVSESDVGQICAELYTTWNKVFHKYIEDHLLNPWEAPLKFIGGTSRISFFLVKC